MKASDFIDLLQHRVEQYGDLPIVGGYITDESGVREITAIDSDGCGVEETGGQPVGYFLEA